MADPVDPLTGLFGLRLAQTTPADALAALAAGLLLAAAFGALAAALPRLSSRAPGAALARRLGQAKRLPPPERVVALAGLLREATDAHAPGEGHWSARAASRFGLEPEVFDALGPGLYRPGASPDPAALERATEAVVAELAA